MYLENLVFDAVDPQRLGRFWEAALGSRKLTDEPGIYETRLSVPDGPELDLCFGRVEAAPTEPLRLHLDLRGDAEQEAVAARLRELGATDLDIGQGDVPWIVMADPEGNPFCVMESREVYSNTGPIAAIPIDSADPERDGKFWSWLTGWVPAPGVSPVTLRHPSMRGVLLEFGPEPGPIGDGKNRLHLDVRLETGDDPDAVFAKVVELGGGDFPHNWGELPWRVCVDPSGNQFCLLPARG
ncbi:VOC family protein [Knoellia koreensis]|uniref:VOC family protein n=1 Tax=Knoellia koreensis TaxID=2730921 RepID=A0A849H4I0_9MICO|nr:VOC family protein [Knoellia sp. DB2414S]NNM44700.1 VOC family protein [Knoellia sp. DB2414S]